MKILLHTCCAPCLIHPLGRLKELGYEVSVLFYNPNIHPFGEYVRRRQALEEFCREDMLQAFYPGYSPAEFFQAVNLIESRPQRCPVCWFLRLNRTAELAKDNGFDAFTTTLLVSPYQDHDALKRIGSDISRDREVDFFYEDFRPGFRRAQSLAKERHIYCQNYCGCIYSEIERHNKG